MQFYFSFFECTSRLKILCPFYKGNGKFLCIQVDVLRGQRRLFQLGSAEWTRNINYTGSLTEFLHCILDLCVSFGPLLKFDLRKREREREREREGSLNFVSLTGKLSCHKLHLMLVLQMSLSCHTSDICEMQALAWHTLYTSEKLWRLVLWIRFTLVSL